MAALRSCGVVVKEDRVSRSLFVTDAGGLAFGISQGVVTPRSAEEVAAVLQAAQQHRVPVTTRGGGLTTDGESVATGGCLLDLSAINRVLHVDADGLTARVEAGIHWHTLAEHLRRKGLDYISAPLNFTSSVGGTLAVGGLDINSFRHGCSADQAVALRVVTPTGTIVECSGREQSALFEQVLFGYGQFGVIVEATLRIRPYTPISMLYWVYPSLRRALEDYIAVVEADAADYAGVITINDTANALFVAFDSDVREHTFTSTWTPRLRGMTAGRFAASMLLHFGMRPWRWSEASFMALRARGILLGLHRPEHRQDGKLVDRASLLSRLVWTQWGSRQVVNPNLCTTATKLISVVEHGAAVCKRWLPFYTLYIIAARRHPGRTRYELSALPPDAGELAFGCSFEPTMRPGDHSPEHLQRFKDDLFAVGLEYQCSYYRFGGRMKAFIRRALGDAVVDKHLAIKRRMDPGMILNPHVIF